MHENTCRHVAHVFQVRIKLCHIAREIPVQMAMNTHDCEKYLRQATKQTHDICHSYMHLKFKSS